MSTRQVINYNKRGVNKIKQMAFHRRLCLFVQLHTAALRLTVRSWLDVPTFATWRLHACHHARTPSGGRWNCRREMSGNFA